MSFSEDANVELIRWLHDNKAFVSSVRGNLRHFGADVVKSVLASDLSACRAILDSTSVVLEELSRLSESRKYEAVEQLVRVASEPGYVLHNELFDPDDVVKATVVTLDLEGLVLKRSWDLDGSSLDLARLLWTEDMRSLAHQYVPADEYDKRPNYDELTRDLEEPLHNESLARRVMQRFPMSTISPGVLLAHHVSKEGFGISNPGGPEVPLEVIRVLLRDGRFIQIGEHERCEFMFLVYEAREVATCVLGDYQELATMWEFSLPKPFVEKNKTKGCVERNRQKNLSLTTGLYPIKEGLAWSQKHKWFSSRDIHHGLGMTLIPHFLAHEFSTMTLDPHFHFTVPLKRDYETERYRSVANECPYCKR